MAKPVDVQVVTAAKDALPLWLAALPDPFDATEGRDAADRALADARNVVWNVKSRFAGTIPPAPWPMTPELQRTIANMQTARDFFDTMTNHPTSTPLKWHQVDPKIVVGPTFVGLARKLYEQLADLEAKASAATSIADLVKLIPRPSEMWAAIPTVVLFALGYVAWSEWKHIRRAFTA
jgi:hypothetical protein